MQNHAGPNDTINIRSVDAEKWFGTFPRNLEILGLQYALGLRYALGLGRAFDLENSKCSVRSRAPVWYRPKALRCLSLGRCAICLEFLCGTVDVNCGTATCPWGSPPSPLARVLGMGFEVVFGRKCCPTRLTSGKSEGRVEWTGEGTSGHFVFRASRAVSPP
ncbi:unnamed protein product [Prunus armeniaca]